MNYIGSKIKLSAFIKDTVTKTVGKLDDKVFCDIFAGTGAVGKLFKPLVKTVISNDMEYYSFVLNRNYIGNYSSLNTKQLIEKLNLLKPVKGFMYKHYSIEGHGERQYFSNENAQKIDAIRIEIQRLYSSKKIDKDIYFYLLASLLESADKVANTASVYGAYLKQLKKSAQKKLVLQSAEYDKVGVDHQVYNSDAGVLIKAIKGDILYLDPPYNQRQYGSNYHILNTIAQYYEFEPKGKTGLREYTRSDYCKKNGVAKAFEELISNARFKYIFLSYNNEGLMSADTVKNIMSKYGSYSLEKTEYKRFKADKTENRNHTSNSVTEFLHVLVKD